MPSALGARRALFVAVVVVHLIALYTPRTGVSDPGGGVDKLVHMALFAVVLYVGHQAEVPIRPLVLLLVADAVISELAQYLWLARRAGEVGDSVADVVGIGLAYLMIRRDRVRVAR